jgi:hypothetical protein
MSDTVLVGEKIRSLCKVRQLTSCHVYPIVWRVPLLSTNGTGFCTWTKCWFLFCGGFCINGRCVCWLAPGGKCVPGFQQKRDAPPQSTSDGYRRELFPEFPEADLSENSEESSDDKVCSVDSFSSPHCKWGQVGEYCEPGTELSVWCRSCLTICLRIERYQPAAAEICCAGWLRVHMRVTPARPKVGKLFIIFLSGYFFSPDNNGAPNARPYTPYLSRTVGQMAGSAQRMQQLG